MKATMNENGMITIQPESSVEAYALRKWTDHQKINSGDGPVSLDSLDCSKLMIDAEWPQDGSTKHESPRGIIDYLGEKAMTVTDEQCIDLGANMWLALADTFHAAMKADGITDIADQTLVFAGFVNCMAGGMLTTLGADVVQAIFDQAKDNCARHMRSRFVVVPK